MYRAYRRTLTSVVKGTTLPRDLVLVHERSDHYSLQPSVAMPLEGEFHFLCNGVAED